MRTLVLLLAALAVPAVARAGERYEAKVVEIMDGDTVGALRTDTRAHVKIRLYGIDAPEKSQPFGNQSKKSLSELVFGKTVAVEVQTVDRYGRAVGRLRAEGRDVNAEQVRRGLAWVYARYNKDTSLPPLEAEARAARRGLWSEANPQAPWDYRRGGARRGAPAAKPAPAAAGAFACGHKRFCKEMTSCAEARFYLTECGRALDGDGDGVPCEALCAP